LLLEPEFITGFAASDMTFIVRPLYRWHSEKKKQHNFDIREAAIEAQYAAFDFRLGVRKVFWGVSESQHVVDIINQTDLAHAIDGEEKLGQPMFNINFRPDFASFEFFLLPYFRERTFKDNGTRFGLALPLADAQYENKDREKHIDFAARTKFTLFQSLDIALSHFYGTNREPGFLVQSGPNGLALTPYYSIVNQSGFELQWTMGNLAIKSEGFFRSEKNIKTWRTNTGFEYSFFQVFNSSKDFGLIAEYNYDSRDENALTPFQDDWFVGGRLGFNNESSTELIAGGFFDTRYKSLTVKIELNHRLTDSLSSSFNLFSFFNVKPQEFFYTNRKDGFMEFVLNYHF
jgi:hypothetical protein